LKGGRGGAIAFGTILLLVLGYLRLFPNEERVIRRRFDQLARVASAPANAAPLAQLARAQELTGFFTRDVVITVAGHAIGTIEGRDQLRSLAAAARVNMGPVRIRFPDVQIQLSPDRQAAAVDLTVLAEFSGDRNVEVHEFKGALCKQDGRWLIRRLDAIKDWGE
jgi:hypothetical protein